MTALAGSIPGQPARAALRLVRDESDDAHEVCAFGLSSAEPLVRAAAVRLAAAAGAAAVVGDALGDADPDVWSTAASCLAELEPADAWTALRRCPPEHRGDVLSGVLAWDERRLERFALAWSRSEDARLRALGLMAAASAGTDACRARIAAGLTDPDASVRRRAARALGAVGEAREVEALSGAVHDPDTGVRREVAAALATAGSRGAAALVAMIGDPDESVAATCVRGIAPSVDAAVAQQIVQALASPDLSGPAADLLGALPPRGVAAVLAALPDDDAMGTSLRSGLRADQLAALLRDVDPRVRGRAVRAMRGAPGAVDALADALRDPVVEVRVDAVRALAACDDARAAEALRTAFELDPSPLVVAAADEALRSA